MKNFYHIYQSLLYIYSLYKEENINIHVNQINIYNFNKRYSTIFYDTNNHSLNITRFMDI